MGEGGLEERLVELGGQPVEVGPGEARAVEFEYTPPRVGQRRATVSINAGGLTLGRRGPSPGRACLSSGR